MASLKNAVLRSTFDRECLTIRRLRVIAPGERVRYYLGNLADDLRHSRSGGLETVGYTSTLQQIIDLVERLTDEKRVRTYTKTEKREHPVTKDLFVETHYYAVGI